MDDGKSEDITGSCNDESAELQNWWASSENDSKNGEDISTTFNMYTEAVPVQYNEKNDAPALEKTDAASDEDFKTYLKSIKSVTVNGTSYAASGRRAVKLINEDGSLDLTKDAFKDEKTRRCILQSPS